MAVSAATSAGVFMLDDHADDARKGRPVNARGGTNKNRRQRTPTVVALMSESFQLRNRSGCRGESAVPRSEFDAGTFQNTDLNVRRNKRAGTEQRPAAAGRVGVRGSLEAKLGRNHPVVPDSSALTIWMRKRPLATRAFPF